MTYHGFRIILGVDEILCEDIEGYRYAVELETERKLKRFWLFSYLIGLQQKENCFIM